MPKIRKKGGKIRKKEEKLGRKGKNREGSFTLSHLIDRAVYAIGAKVKLSWINTGEALETAKLQAKHRFQWPISSFTYSVYFCMGSTSHCCTCFSNYQSQILSPSQLNNFLLDLLQNVVRQVEGLSCLSGSFYAQEDFI